MISSWNNWNNNHLHWLVVDPNPKLQAKPFHGTLLFGRDHETTHGPWLRSICSQCEFNSNQRTNTWISHGSSFSSLIPPTISLLFSTKLNCCENKIEGFSSKELYSCCCKDAHMWQMCIPTYQLKCIIIEHSQRKPMNLNFSMGGGAMHIFCKFWFHSCNCEQFMW